MGKCTKMRCPMQAGIVDENCDIKDCPYRTESPTTEMLIDMAQKYIENTVEVTKTIRLPKGENCESCVFSKSQYSPFLAGGNSGCGNSGSYVWCTLYGERLEIDKDMSLVSTMLPNSSLTFRKCARCLDDTSKID